MEAKLKKAIKDFTSPNTAAQQKAAMVIEDMFVKTPSLRKSFVQYGGIGPVVALCGAPKDKGVTERCVALLVKLMENYSEAIQPLVDGGALGPLCALTDLSCDYCHGPVTYLLQNNAASQMLKEDTLIPNLVRMCSSEDASVQLGSVKIIGYLCFLGGAEGQEKVASANAISRLIHLSQSESPALKLAAVTSLHGFTFLEANQGLAAEAGCIPSLVAALNMTDDFENVNQLRMAAAGALHNLSKYENNRSVIAESDGISALLSLCGLADLDILIETAGAIRNLALLDSNIEVLIEADAAASLSPLLSTGGDDVVVQAVNAIKNIATDSVDFRIRAGESDVIDRLMKLLPCKNVEILIDIVDTLCILCTDVPNNRTLAGKSNSIGILVQIISEHQTNEDVIRSVCQAIIQLCLENRQNQLSMNKHEGFSALIALFRSSSVVIQENSVESLYAACVDIELNRLEACRVGAVAPLIYLARSPEISVRSWCERTLHVLGVSNPRFRSCWKLHRELPKGFVAFGQVK